MKMEINEIEHLYETIHKTQRAKYGTKNEPSLSPSVLSRFIAMLAVDDQIFDSCILELGIGFGNISIGLSLIGAGYIMGVDFDQDQLNICGQNIELYRRQYGDNGANIDLVLGDVYNESFMNEFDELFDIIVLNPPADLAGKKDRHELRFIKSALRLHPDVVYCILPTDIRDACQLIAKERDMFCDIISTINFDQDQPIDFVKFHFPKDDTASESFSCNNLEALSSIETDLDPSEHSVDYCSDKDGSEADLSEKSPAI